METKRECVNVTTQKTRNEGHTVKVIPLNAISTNLAREEFYIIIYNSGRDHLGQFILHEFLLW